MEDHLVSILCFERILILSHYLGLPLFRSNMISDFPFLLDKLDRKLTCWKSKFLSKAGRLMLTKEACLTIPTNAMQSIALPKAVCFTMDAKIHRFW